MKGGYVVRESTLFFKVGWYACIDFLYSLCMSRRRCLHSRRAELGELIQYRKCWLYVECLYVVFLGECQDEPMFLFVESNDYSIIIDRLFEE